MATFRTATLMVLAVALSVAPAAAEDRAPGMGTETPYRVSVTFDPGAGSRVDGHDWHLRSVPARDMSPARSSVLSTTRRSLRPETDSTPAHEPARFQSRQFIKEHPAKFGALVGAAIGAVVGIVSVATLDCPPTRSCSTAGVALLAFPLYGAGAGAIVGWAIGAGK